MKFIFTKRHSLCLWDFFNVPVLLVWTTFFRNCFSVYCLIGCTTNEILGRFREELFCTLYTLLLIFYGNSEAAVGLQALHLLVDLSFASPNLELGCEFIFMTNIHGFCMTSTSKWEERRNDIGISLPLCGPSSCLWVPFALGLPYFVSIFPFQILAPQIQGPASVAKRIACLHNYKRSNTLKKCIICLSLSLYI